MITFKIWESLSNEELAILRGHGFQLIDQFEAGPYLMYLLEVSGPSRDFYPADMVYQLGFQEEGKTATSSIDQYSKEGKSLNAMQGWRDLKSLLYQKLSEWLMEHGPISVASMNPAKTKKWGSLIKKVGFKTESKSFQGLGQVIEYVVIHPMES